MYNACGATWDPRMHVGGIGAQSSALTSIRRQRIVAGSPAIWRIAEWRDRGAGERSPILRAVAHGVEWNASNRSLGGSLTFVRAIAGMPGDP